MRFRKRKLNMKLWFQFEKFRVYLGIQNLTSNHFKVSIDGVLIVRHELYFIELPLAWPQLLFGYN